MSKTVKTIVTRRQPVPEAYLAMVRLHRTGKAIRSRKDYSRREKHKGSAIRMEIEQF